MDRVTRAKVDSLLYAVRAWKNGLEQPPEELARRFQLDPLLVRSLLRSEGFDVAEDPADAPAPERESNPNQITQVMSADEVRGDD